MVEYVYINEHAVPRIFVEHIDYFKNATHNRLILEHPKFSSLEIAQNFIKFSGICYVNRPDNRVIRGLHLKYPDVIPCQIDYNYHYDFDEVIKFSDKMEYIDIDDLSGISDLTFLIFVRFAPNITGEKINELFMDTRNPDFRIVRTWDISKMSNFSYMFSNLPTFNEDISGWNMENCERADAMFQNCYSFSQDLSNWNMENCKSAISMFSGCVKLDIGDEFIHKLNENISFMRRFQSETDEIYKANTKINMTRKIYQDYRQKFASKLSGDINYVTVNKWNKADVDKFNEEKCEKLDEMREVCRDFKEDDENAAFSHMLHVPERNKDLLCNAGHSILNDYEKVNKLLKIDTDKMRDNTINKENYRKEDDKIYNHNYLN